MSIVERKRTPYRFTIGFHAGDPAHRQVVDLLNQQGRRKAQLIVNAVLHYINCPEAPNIPLGLPAEGTVGAETMEAVVRRILAEQREQKEILPPEKGEGSQTEPVQGELKEPDLLTIADTLAAFRAS